MLRQRATKAPFTFEILVTTRDQERIALAFRATSSAPASTRRCARSMPCSSTSAGSAYDFDMIQNRWDQSLSPGNEQSFYWGSAGRRQSRAPATTWAPRIRPIDAMIAALLEARDHAGLRLGGAGARPRPDVRLLRYPAV